MGKSQNKDPGDEERSGLGLGGLFRGLGDLLEKVGELAETGQELRREGTIDGLGGKKGVQGVYGFTVKFGGLGRDPVRVEPFGNLKKDAGGATRVADEREPVVDLFDEADHVLVVAELPGVEEAQVKTEVRGDVLVVTAAGKERKYRKEVLLPAAFEAAAMSRRLCNGILEVRFDKGGAAKRR